MKLVKRNKIYKDEYLIFFQDEVKFSDGSEGTYVWTDRKNGVGIVVVTTDKKILLNKEFRYVIGDYSWEIPGGGIDEGEDVIVAAKRELYEETGIRTNSIDEIGFFYPLNSFNTETITLFLAKIKKQKATASKTETSEQFAEQKYVSFEEALKMIDRGEIVDLPTSNAIQIAVRRMSKK